MIPRFNKLVLSLSIAATSIAFPALATTNSNDNSMSTSEIRIVTGGYEAIAADNEKREIAGPRTTAVKEFLKRQGLEPSIETMIWSRAYNIATNTDNVLIYPLTRTQEREKYFRWIRKIDEHHFHLIGHTNVQANSLSKKEIISGKYFAVCEKTTSNCHMLRQYGFPDENIFRVRGAEVEGIVMRLAVGRASFMMENQGIVSEIVARRPSLKGKLEKVHDVTVVMEDYLAASALTPKYQKLLLPQTSPP